ncbi:MAG: hypothetical protein LBF97_02915 [Elusimicrobiota bacterium]|jgi:hypothetical protein|nr:hypothetical protein [Elusimicrobiota bacterium]
MIDPKEIIIGNRTYIISKLPAVVGREIIYKYPTSLTPKIGDYAVSENTMLKLMKYVAVKFKNGTEQTLSTKELINNNVDNALDLLKLEFEMLEYNFNFFRSGKFSDFLSKYLGLATAKITEILMDLSGKSSQAEKQRSTN